MAIPKKPQILNNVIAHDGDIDDIPQTAPVDSGRLSIASGWPRITALPLTAGGIAPSREGFNGIFNLLSQHIFSQQSGQLYMWDESLSYPAGSVIRAANGNIYISAADNGADYHGIGAKNPVTERIYWTPLIASGAVPLESGGTGAKTAANARINLGLGNVNNTSDRDKPISTATQSALDSKQPKGSYALVEALYEQKGWCNIGGFIIQWGKVEMIQSEGKTPIDFKRAFPNACFACTLTQPDLGYPGNDFFWRVSELTRTSFSIRSKQTASNDGLGALGTSFYIAVGH